MGVLEIKYKNCVSKVYIIFQPLLTQIYFMLLYFLKLQCVL